MWQWNSLEVVWLPPPSHQWTGAQPSLPALFADFQFESPCITRSLRPQTIKTSNWHANILRLKKSVDWAKTKEPLQILAFNQIKFFRISVKSSSHLRIILDYWLPELVILNYSIKMFLWKNVLIHFIRIYFKQKNIKFIADWKFKSLTDFSLADFW